MINCNEFMILRGYNLYFMSMSPFILQTKLDLGEILLSLNYLPSAGRLNVDVIKAKQLLQTDLVGGSGR